MTHNFGGLTTPINVLATGALLFGVAGSATVSAHNWGRGPDGYHWNRSGENADILVSNESTAQGAPLADAAVRDWESNTVLNLPAAGPVKEVQVYDANSGPTAWAGLAEITSWEQRFRGHIGGATAEVNTFYTDSYSDVFVQGIFCQEVGHTFGLDHSDTGDCMGLGYYSDTTFFVGPHNVQDIEDKYAVDHHSRPFSARFEVDTFVQAYPFWAYRPDTLQDAFQMAERVVVGTVVDIAPGLDINSERGLEGAGSRQIPTRVITLSVDDQLKGTSDGLVTVFQTGSEDWSVVGDPRYQDGERYLLFLTPRGDGSDLVVSPAGRYQIIEGRLAPVADYRFARTLTGVSLDDVRQRLSGLQD